MTRPAEYTRQAIIKAATDLFAEKGFEAASVRDIVAKARVNQAAINYHFKGKGGLYLEVLRVAFESLTRHMTSDSEKLRALGREVMLRKFISRQLRPLLIRDEVSRYIRIFAWESVRPTKVLRKFLATNAAPFLDHAGYVVRSFLPPRTPERDVLCATIWLMGQCSIFVRNGEQLGHPPFNLKIDEDFVRNLTDLIATWAMAGLAAVPANRAHAA